MEHYSINKNEILETASNYSLLRQYGLEYISRLSGKVWTDYNIHDPGITILELLCYALTDLGYRTSFDIKDILTPVGKQSPDLSDAFHSAKEILITHPITSNDYRKWIINNLPRINIDGKEISCVNNVWIVPLVGKELNVHIECYLNKKNHSQDSCTTINLKGFYKIIVDVTDEELLKSYDFWRFFGRQRNGRYVSQKLYEENYIDYLRAYIWNMVLNRRNLCEDIDDVVVLKKIKTGICLDVEINQDVNYRFVLHEINNEISRYVNNEQILAEKKEQLNVSDAINLIMSIKGVKNIRHLHFTPDTDLLNKGIITETSNHFNLNLSEPERYAFQFDKNKNDIIVTRGLLSFKDDLLNDEPLNAFTNPFEEESDITPPVGKNRELDNYISIQDEFPKIYHLGKELISDSATNLRKAQRMQLKAYLIFFDQILADYLAQLNSVKDILSWKEEAERTYLYKELSDKEIVEFEKIASYENYDEIIESKETRLDRRNRFLNHLIARFNEEFVVYSVLKFNKEKMLEKDFFFKEKEEMIKDKISFLKNYDLISCNRSHAVDYTDPQNNRKAKIFDRLSENYNCLLESQIFIKLGLAIERINDDFAPKVLRKEKGKIIFEDNRNGDYNDNFGIHVYEHILFRPVGDAEKKNFICLTSDINSSDIVKDPYSMQITVVVPAWFKFAEDYNFRLFVEQTIRMEVPAHIAVKICWLDPLQMLDLEKANKKFMDVLSKRNYPVCQSMKMKNAEKSKSECEKCKDELCKKWKNKYENSLINFIEIFSSLKSIYLPIKLYNDEKIMSQNTAVLGYSILTAFNTDYEWEKNSILNNEMK